MNPASSPRVKSSVASHFRLSHAREISPSPFFRPPASLSLVFTLVKPYLILQLVDEDVDEQRDLLLVGAERVSLKTGGRHVHGDQDTLRAITLNSPAAAGPSRRPRSRHHFPREERTPGAGSEILAPSFSFLLSLSLRRSFFRCRGILFLTRATTSRHTEGTSFITYRSLIIPRHALSLFYRENSRGEFGGYGSDGVDGGPTDGAAHLE